MKNLLLNDKRDIIRGQKNKGAATLQTVGTEAAADDKEDR